MELFTRDLVLFGPAAEINAWVTKVSESFEEKTGRETAVWVSMAGGKLGHHTWSMAVDGSADLLDLRMRVLGDADYLSTVEEGRHLFRGTPYDTLYRPYGDAPIRMGAAGSVCTVTRADAAAGQLGEAVGWGLEIAHHVETLTGVPTVLMSSPAGHFSRLTWLAVAEDARTADEADRQARADDGYRKLLARGGSLFVPGSGRSQWFLRTR